MGKTAFIFPGQGAQKAGMGKDFYEKYDTAKEVFDAAKAGDAAALEITEEFGAYLGQALVNLAATVDPAVFVIGGGVSKAGDILLETVRKYFYDHAFYGNQKTKITLATLGNDAGIYGAAKQVL